jgi:hypothetical protein
MSGRFQSYVLQIFKTSANFLLPTIFLKFIHMRARKMFMDLNTIKNYIYALNKYLVHINIHLCSEQKLRTKKCLCSVRGLEPEELPRLNRSRAQYKRKANHGTKRTTILAVTRRRKAQQVITSDLPSQWQDPTLQLEFLDPWLTDSLEKVFGGILE